MDIRAGIASYFVADATQVVILRRNHGLGGTKTRRLIAAEDLTAEVYASSAEQGKVLASKGKDVDETSFAKIIAQSSPRLAAVKVSDVTVIVDNNHDTANAGLLAGLIVGILLALISMCGLACLLCYKRIALKDHSALDAKGLEAVPDPGFEPTNDFEGSFYDPPDMKDAPTSVYGDLSYSNSPPAPRLMADPYV